MKRIGTLVGLNCRHVGVLSCALAHVWISLVKTLWHGSGDAAKCGFVSDIFIGEISSRELVMNLKDEISEDWH